MHSDGGPIVFVHSSDEHYGADRILLDIEAALPADWRPRAEFWLPTDMPHGSRPLCHELERRGARVRHVDLPVLRRAYLRPRGLVGLSRRLLALHRELRAQRPDVVYCTTSAMFLVAPIARRAGARVIGHVQEIWGPTETRVLGPMANRLHQVIAISGAVRDSLPAPVRQRTVVVLNATPEPPSSRPLTEHDGPLRFLVASRWNAWKGHRTLLEAWDRLDHPGRLVVLGAAPSSGGSVDVPALVRELRFPESVEVVGEVDDAGTWIEGADVVVMPSDNPEPFGLVAVEAFARGRPVLASDGGGLSDIVSDGEDGWLFTRRDPEALAEVLTGLTRASVATAGAAARQSYEQRFTADRYAEDWRRACVEGGISDTLPSR